MTTEFTSKFLHPDETDAVALWAEIIRLRAAVKGPDGFATWQDAATSERVRRVKAEQALAAEKEAAAKQQPVGTLTVRRYRGHLENTDFDYSGALPDGSYPLYLAPQPAPLPTDDPGTYYVSGPYFDGSMAVCRLDTGLVVHKFRLDDTPQPAPRPTAAKLNGLSKEWCMRMARLEEESDADFAVGRPTAAEVPLPEPGAYINDPNPEDHDVPVFFEHQLRTHREAYADAVVAKREPVRLAESQIVSCLVSANCVGTVKMSYESGPYEVTRTSLNADNLARAIETAVLKANGLVP